MVRRNRDPTDRNLKLGFHIVEFYNEFNKDLEMPEELDGMFRFQKRIG